jgi:hypothetical protein
MPLLEKTVPCKSLVSFRFLKSSDNAHPRSRVKKDAEEDGSAVAALPATPLSVDLVIPQTGGFASPPAGGFAHQYWERQIQLKIQLRKASPYRYVAIERHTNAHAIRTEMH